MTLNEKLNILEDVLDMEHNALREDTVLAGLEEWDSIAAITIISMFDSIYERELAPETVKSFKTVGDILKEME